MGGGGWLLAGMFNLYCRLSPWALEKGAESELTLFKMLNSHGRYGEPELSAFIENRCQKKILRSHNNTIITLHIVVPHKPS